MLQVGAAGDRHFWCRSQALPRHWARDFYLVHVSLDAQNNEEALGRLQVRRS